MTKKSKHTKDGSGHDGRCPRPRNPLFWWLYDNDAALQQRTASGRRISWREFEARCAKRGLKDEAGGSLTARTLGRTFALVAAVKERDGVPTPGRSRGDRNSGMSEA